MFQTFTHRAVDFIVFRQDVFVCSFLGYSILLAVSFWCIGKMMQPRKIKRKTKRRYTHKHILPPWEEQPPSLR